jgi:hypothetical protein
MADAKLVTTGHPDMLNLLASRESDSILGVIAALR